MEKQALKVGLVGAHGLVGQTFLKVLEQNHHALAEIRLFGFRTFTPVSFLSKTLTVNNIQGEKDFRGLDVVFLATDEKTSRDLAPILKPTGARVIDNSSAFRLDDSTPLCVPEINGDSITREHRWIANPNCSTIQLVLPLAALQKAFGLRTVQVATYQAVSGAGKDALESFARDMAKTLDEMKSYTSKPSTALKQSWSNLESSFFDCRPQIGTFEEDEYCTEEKKIMRETRKILKLPGLDISAMTVRVPIPNVHSEAVWVEFENSPRNIQEVRDVLNQQEGLVLTHPYPVASQCHGKNPVHIGRLQLEKQGERLRFWCVGDNLLKGAALNGWQIARLGAVK